MHQLPPDEVTRILRSGAGAASEQLTAVLRCFRRRWLLWSRRRFPRWEQAHEDAVQEAGIRILARIDQLRDATRVEHWANAVFRSVLYEMIDRERSRRRWYRETSPGHDPDDELDREPDCGPTPEAIVSAREQLQMVKRIVQECPPAMLRFLHELSEKEIGEATKLSRNSVATQLKRMRVVLRRVLDETDADGRPLPTERIVERIGLSREMVTRLVKAIDEVLGRNGRRRSTDDGDPEDQ
jgi:RNA polymerase sigma factor (sigma-70 family)